MAFPGTGGAGATGTGTPTGTGGTGTGLTGGGGDGPGGTGTGGTGTGGTGGTGGSGGAPECVVGGDCPGEDTDCATRTCEGGVCGVSYEAAEHPCDFDGGDVCDGAGACLKSLGQPCTDVSECLSGECVDDVCCNSPCGGACEACNLSPQVGTCSPHAAGTDPDLDCTGVPPGVCDGARACAYGSCLWSDHFGDVSSGQTAFAVAVDSTDRILVLGDYDGTLDFGTACTPHTATAGHDVFLAAFQADGTCVWSNSYSSTGGNDEAHGLAVGLGDSIVITGQFGTNVDLGTGPLLSAGNTDVFLAKLDASGNTTWATSFGDSHPDSGARVAVDANDNILLAGNFEGDIALGGTPQSSVDGQDIFLAKFDGQGTHTWSKSFGGIGADQVWDMTVDGAGDVIIVGGFQNDLDLDGAALASSGAEDAFVAKYDSGGNHLWSVKYGAAGAQRAISVATDSNDDVVVTGGFHGTVDFGGGPLVSAGGWDVFFTRYDAGGNYLNSVRFGDSADVWQVGWSMTIDGSDNIIAAIDLYGSIDFGGGTLTTAGAADTVAVKFAPDFTHLWSHRYGAAQDQWIMDVAVDSTNHPVLAGILSGSADFGCGVLQSAGGEDTFAARLDP